MKLQEIQNRNYQATVKRGLITPKTTDSEFIEKLKEEVDELQIEVDLPFFSNTTGRDMELADVIIVCLCMAKHLNIDIESELIKKTIYNENRND